MNGINHALSTPSPPPSHACVQTWRGRSLRTRYCRKWSGLYCCFAACGQYPLRSQTAYSIQILRNPVRRPVHQHAPHGCSTLTGTGVGRYFQTFPRPPLSLKRLVRLKLRHYCSEVKLQEDLQQSTAGLASVLPAASSVVSYAPYPTFATEVTAI
jgi:hypothetical protein